MPRHRRVWLLLFGMSLAPAFTRNPKSLGLVCWSFGTGLSALFFRVPNRATHGLHPVGWEDCMVREEQLLVAWAVLVPFSMLGSLLIGRYCRCTNCSLWQKRRFDPLCDITGDGCDEHRLPDHDMHMPTAVCEDALLPNFSLAQCQSVRLDMGDITGKPIQPNEHMPGPLQMESCNPALAPRRM